MHAIKAIYDGKNFLPTQPIPVKEDYEVVITFVEPLKKDARNKKNSANNNVEKKTKLPRSTSIGLLEGKVWMSDDFNEPIGNA